MPTIEEIQLSLSSESKERKTEDNSLKVLLSNEKAERSEADATNRIKIANESVNRAEADSSIAVKLAKEVSDRATKNSELEIRIAKLEALINNSNQNFDDEKDYVYKVLTEYKYPISYTQGLVFHQGKLYESTGLYGKSVVRRIDIESNQIEKEIKIGDQYFGEGITIFNNKIIHITWKSQTGFVYDLDLNQLEEFKFTTTRNEGWGITHDNKNLIVSDGSEYLHFWNPETKKEVRKIQVLDNGVPVKDLNELEYFEGYVLANVWMTNKIVVVNAETGVVENTIDFSELAKNIVINDSDSVFNGIAYDGTNFYVTGKNWGKIWKIDLNIKGKETSDKSSEESKTLMINQEMFERQLNMLKRSAKFILTNANIEELAKTKESSVEFLRHLNNLQLTFDNLLTNKDKYTLTDATNKCIEEAESLKKQLDEFANDNWDVERLFVDNQGRHGHC